MYYGCTREDAAKIGFDDNYIYDVIKGEADEKRVSFVQMDRDTCLEAFREWEQKQDKVRY
ncbi:tRNA-specific adenosine-34 deaminase [Acetivibrio straminisolvens JCM 21531]|uniref:tRNA-specific adenosine-34 deaminase n=1 Tax=Acetivibrio straminisolvens JCM 21531 TaxID=1294263 RepID=W4VC37_9FIRM|nr:tRNA-specific adenosine-34 deaminase [Acetivibrio straminisolvens JCM 21531]